MPPTPRLAVVIPVRDGERTITNLLDALAAQELAPVEVVVVDDGSTDGTAALVRDHRIGARVVRTPGAGSYAARNAGVAACRVAADGVAFTDADCRPDPGWLRALGAAMDDGADMVAGRIVQEVSGQPSVWERYDAATYLDQRELVEHAGFGATANLALRTSVLEDIGGFDVALRSSGDLELGRRAVAAGYRLVYAQDAVVRHRPRRTPRGLWHLHRRLGAGWAALSRRDGGPSVWRDERLRPSLGFVVDRVVGGDGPALRRRHLLGPHVVVVAARLVGRVTGR